MIDAPMQHSEPLPDFKAPPVVEVVLSVRLAPVLGLSSPQMGILWSKNYRADFPTVEQQAPIEPGVEHFGGPAPSISLKLEAGMPVPRLWFVNRDGSQLIQLQQNWFAFNWRRPTPRAAEYPRFTRVKASFQRNFLTLQEFVTNEGLGKVQPEQCEVTYVNHISRSDFWESHGQLDKVLKLFGSTDEFLPEPEEASLDAHYIFSREDRPIGRLHFNARPLYILENQEPVFQLTVTARGKPETGTAEGIFGFLELGHEWVVRGFTAVTTKEAHEAWERAR